MLPYVAIPSHPFTARFVLSHIISSHPVLFLRSGGGLQRESARDDNTPDAADAADAMLSRSL